jgi:quercetin dioxygenase-like cupin family protein
MLTDLSKECADCGLCAESLSECEQPPIWEHRTADNVFIKQMFIKEKGTFIPQHSHRYDHTSMLATGSVRVWMDGQLVGDLTAPCPIFIEAFKKHTFMSLEPNTLLYCIHNVTRGREVEIHLEH